MDGARIGEVESRKERDVTIYGWTPWDFVRGGLLRFCFGDANDRNNQLSFIEQKVRAQLVRWGNPCTTPDGSIVLADPGAAFPKTFEKALQQRKRDLNPGDGTHIRDFGDLVDFLDGMLSSGPNQDWDGGVQSGTVHAFLRRLYAVSQRLGQLVSTNVTKVELRHSVSVIDIHSLHDDAQRFVVGALLFQIFDAKQGTGREPLQFIVLDELNKYAPREGSSPIKELLVDIAARGRSLGVILIGAQQSAADVEKAITTNAAIKIVGRLDAGSAVDYRFLSPELQDRASRFLPGTMIIDQPIVPAPIPFRFPFAAYATNVNEAGDDDDPDEVDAIFGAL
ncbi:MAG TPA: ATP-binding protein [Candidatus Baltobacteraceae bacterium]